MTKNGVLIVALVPVIPEKEINSFYEQKNINWTKCFFSSVLVLMDKVTWYLLLVDGGIYPVKLVEMLAS